MTFFYDKNLLMSPTDNGKTIVYSSILNKRLRVDKHSAFLFSLILQRNGRLSTEEIASEFSREFGMDLEREELETLLKNLKGLNFLFDSREELDACTSEMHAKILRMQNAPLTMAYLHLTMRCNFNCVYCYNRDVENEHREELSTREWINALKALREAGVSRLTITGGEPLVRKDIGELLKQAHDLGFNIGLLTNGSLLESKYEEVVPYTDSIILSLDSGDQETNSRNRSGLGFDGILRTLKRLSKESPDKIAVRTVITKANIKEVQEFHDTLRKEFKIPNLIKLVFIPNNHDEIPLMPTPDNLYRDNSVKFEAKPATFYGCSAGKAIIAVSPNGDLYPCQNLVYKEFRMGNMFDPDWLRSAQGSVAADRIKRSSVNDKEKCRDCAYKYLCGGGCPAIGHRVYHRLDAHLEFFCQYLKEEAKCRLLSSTADWQNSSEGGKI